ncbi:MAG: undecaprenyl-diphosphate phosphatase [Oscillospiraceae bacterium]|nr:undecaprenyl-diphosphate phosphatase [Oscillospiraceae bacterium]
MNFFDAVIQGIVQGLTEFLPVSSSGHLSLVQHFTGRSGETGAMFSVLLHFGTLVAVFVAFFPTIRDLAVEFFRMLGDLFTGKFTWKGQTPPRRMIFMLLLALLPLGAAYLIKDFYAAFSEDGDILVEGCCFLVTAALLFLADRVRKGDKDAAGMKPGDALAVGVAQALAPMPGISRSGSTIAVGLMMGLSREYAVAFSFILGIPAVLAANLLEFKDALAAGSEVSLPVLLVGMAVSGIVGFFAIKMVKWLVKTDHFEIFAWYTLILGILTVGVGIYELAVGHPLTLFS